MSPATKAGNQSKRGGRRRGRNRDKATEPRRHRGGVEWGGELVRLEVGPWGCPLGPQGIWGRSSWLRQLLGNWQPQSGARDGEEVSPAQGLGRERL